MKKILLLATIALMPVTAHASLPEIRMTDDPLCVEYKNFLQYNNTSKEIHLIDGYEVIFKFYREMADNPDTIIIEVPSLMLIPDKDSVTLREFDSEIICFKQYEGF